MASSRLDKEISEKLEACDLFLILVNPDFLASDYCYEQEMERALERRDEGTSIVIPVIVEPCEWQESPLRALKAVPYDGKPISKWDNQSDAYLDIVKEVRRVVNTQKIVIEPQFIDHIKEKAKEQVKGYHIKNEFDEIDRENFGRESFNTFPSAIFSGAGYTNMAGRGAPLGLVTYKIVPTISKALLLILSDPSRCAFIDRLYGR